MGAGEAGGRPKGGGEGPGAPRAGGGRAVRAPAGRPGRVATSAGNHDGRSAGRGEEAGTRFTRHGPVEVGQTAVRGAFAHAAHPSGFGGCQPSPTWGRSCRRRLTQVASRSVKVSTRRRLRQPSPALTGPPRAPSRRPTSVRDIAERTALPQPYLEQILLALKGVAWCAPSARGRRLRTGPPPEQITLAQIVSAVDGPIAAGDFGLPHANGACDTRVSACCSPCGPKSVTTCGSSCSPSPWPTWWRVRAAPPARRWSTSRQISAVPLRNHAHLALPAQHG